MLIVDDELSVRKMLAVMLAQSGVTCSHVAWPVEALEKIQNEAFDAVISDLRMGPVSGMDLLDEVHRSYPDLAFWMATGVADVRVGVQAMKHGADDYLLKPFDTDVVLTGLDRALKKKHLEREVQTYRLHLESMVAERTQQLQVAMGRFWSIQRSRKSWVTLRKQNFFKSTLPIFIAILPIIKRSTNCSFNREVLST